MSDWSINELLWFVFAALSNLLVELLYDVNNLRHGRLVCDRTRTHLSCLAGLAVVERGCVRHNRALEDGAA